MKQSIIIVGGGITGLVIAYLASKKGHEVTVLEASDEVGGLLKTFEIGGTKLEAFYHHFFTHDVEIHWLLRELKLEDRLIYEQSTMGIFRNGRVYGFDGVGDLLKYKPLPFFGKMRFALTSLFLGKFAKWEKYESVSCYEWFHKYAGTQTLKSIWGPLLKIKFGPYFKQIPLAWMVGRLRQRMNSRKDGEEKLGYLDGSLNKLLEHLLVALKDQGVEIKTSSPVSKVVSDGNKVDYIMAGDSKLSADQYVFTIPTTYISDLFKSPFPELSKKLSAIEYFGAYCAILDLKVPLSDRYWLNLSDDNLNFGGIIEHTNFVPPSKYDGKHIAYFSRYYAQSEDIATMDEEQLKQLVLKDLRTVFPDYNESNITGIYSFRSNHAAIVCDLNFSSKVPKVQTDIANVLIANMAHIYPDERSVNNSIRVASNAVELMGIASDVPPGNSLSGKIGFK